MIILICGLPGSGKTFLAKALYDKLLNDNVVWYNADAIRAELDDWDFTYEGRLRQAQRMRQNAEKHDGIVIVDMIAPLPEFRDEIAPDILVWVDTIKEGRFEDTNRIFIAPEHYDFRVTEQDCDKWSEIILPSVKSI